MQKATIIQGFREPTLFSDFIDNELLPCGHGGNERTPTGGKSMSLPDFIRRSNFFSNDHTGITRFLSHFFIPVMPGDTFHSIIENNVFWNWAFEHLIALVCILWLIDWWIKYGYPVRPFSLTKWLVTLFVSYSTILGTTIILNMGMNYICAPYILPPDKDHPYVGETLMLVSDGIHGSQHPYFTLTGTYLDKSMTATTGHDFRPRDGVCEGVIPGQKYYSRMPANGRGIGVLVQKPEKGSPYYAVIYTQIEADRNGCSQGVGLTRSEAGSLWRQTDYAHFLHPWVTNVDQLVSIRSSRHTEHFYNSQGQHE